MRLFYLLFFSQRHRRWGESSTFKFFSQNHSMTSMTRAEKFVEVLYSSFEGRVPFAAGYVGFDKIYPFVYESRHGFPIGLVAAAATKVADAVQLYHISSFKPGKGHGKEIMGYLCGLADEHGVKIYLHAEVQFSDKETPIGEDLVNWYRRFGFVGNGFMCREPKALRKSRS